jgi:hypothetical protein
LNKKYLAVLLTSIFIAALMIITGCSSPAPASQTTTAAAPPAPATKTVEKVVEKDKTYNALSPLGVQPSIDIKSLANRLDTPDGKVIYVNQGEADPIIMPALWDRLNKEYPKVTWKLIATSSFGPSSLEAEVTQTAKAVIRGIAW